MFGSVILIVVSLTDWQCVLHVQLNTFYKIKKLHFFFLKKIKHPTVQTFTPHEHYFCLCFLSYRFRLFFPPLT